MLATGAASRCFLLFVAVWLVACTSSQDVEGCLGDVDVTVRRTIPPRFSWSPACGISNLAVVDPSYQAVWGIEGHVGENAIESPIDFGIVPDGAFESVQPAKLQPGNSYIVRVFRLHRNASGEFELILAGEENFPW